MRVLIAAAGTMGDVAPFTGLGVRLREAGHQVAVAAYEPFAGLIRDCGLEFRPLPGDPRAMVGSEDNRRWQRGGGGVRGGARLVRPLAQRLPEMNDGLLAAARQGADVLLLSQLAMLGGYSIADGLGIPSMGVFVVPIHPTGDFPPALGLPSLGRWGNRTAGRLLLGAGSTPFAAPMRRLRAELGLPPLGPGAMFREQDRRRWPVCYGYSPAVLPRPSDWRPGLQVVGYFRPCRPARPEVPGALGGLPVRRPATGVRRVRQPCQREGARLSALIRDVLRRAGVRGVVQAGWAQLSTVDDDIFTIGELPHDWLFPRMAAVVHHAGAGTTGAALRAGVPSVPVPVAGDQPFWADRLTALGVTPGAAPYQRLTADRLATTIIAAVSQPAYRRRARELAGQVNTEDTSIIDSWGY